MLLATNVASEELLLDTAGLNNEAGIQTGNN